MCVTCFRLIKHREKTSAHSQYWQNHMHTHTHTHIHKDRSRESETERDGPVSSFSCNLFLDRFVRQAQIIDLLKCWDPHFQQKISNFPLALHFHQSICHSSNKNGIIFFYMIFCVCVCICRREIQESWKLKIYDATSQQTFSPVEMYIDMHVRLVAEDSRYFAFIFFLFIMYIYIINHITSLTAVLWFKVILLMFSRRYWNWYHFWMCVDVINTRQMGYFIGYVETLPLLPFLFHSFSFTCSARKL